MSSNTKGRHNNDNGCRKVAPILFNRNTHHADGYRDVDAIIDLDFYFVVLAANLNFFKLLKKVKKTYWALKKNI